MTGMEFAEFFNTGTGALILFLLILWTLPWKGVALWKAARLYHKWWFIVLLVVNTFAVLEIIYIFFVARKAEQEELTEETVQEKTEHTL